MKIENSKLTTQKRERRFVYLCRSKLESGNLGFSCNLGFITPPFRICQGSSIPFLIFLLLFFFVNSILNWNLSSYCFLLSLLLGIVWIMTIPDSTYMMENGSIELPCTSEEEARIIQELMSKAESNLKQGNLFYVVSNRSAFYFDVPFQQALHRAILCFFLSFLFLFLITYKFPQALFSCHQTNALGTNFFCCSLTSIS